MTRLPKPDGKKVCASCKRRVKPEELQDGRRVCRDRPACREATAEWLGRIDFPSGVTIV